jgi:hypothetical protein
MNSAAHRGKMMNVLEKRNTSGATSVVVLPILACFWMLVGCKANVDPTVWKRDFACPSGAWVATARTYQWGGFGSAWVETTVSVKKLDGTVNHGKPFDVFSYPGGGTIPKTYVLSDANADTNLKIAWLTPTHLQIIHQTPIQPDLEVIRFSDIDISFK